MRDAYGGIPSGRLRHDSVHTYRNNRVHIYRHAGCAADESCEQEQNGRPGFGFDSGGLYSVRSIFCTIIFYAAVCSDGIQKEKIHGVEDGCSLSGDSCIGGLYFKDKTYSTRDFYILEVVLLMAFAVMLSYFTELLLGYQMKLHSMRDASMEHDMLMEQMNHQLIEKQNAQIYNATLKERNRIAREIHDNVGHMITRSILQVGAIGVINTDEKLKAPIADLKSTLDTAMDSMRKSVHDLYDESVDLRQALAKLKPTDSAFAFSLEYDCEDDVPRDVKYAFIAIAKEAVNNAVKHSNGDEIRIIVREHPAFYQLEIMDNGTSADERRISGETGDGIGIKNIKERVAAIGGTMRIKADDGFMIFVTLMKKKGTGHEDSNNR